MVVGEKTLLPFASATSVIAITSESIAGSLSAVVILQNLAISTDGNLAASAPGPETTPDISAGAIFNRVV